MILQHLDDQAPSKKIKIKATKPKYVTENNRKLEKEKDNLLKISLETQNIKDWR